jgi:hypothetical protein
MVGRCLCTKVNNLIHSHHELRIIHVVSLVQIHKKPGVSFANRAIGYAVWFVARYGEVASEVTSGSLC